MKYEEMIKLQPGLYLIFWNNGCDMSKAIVQKSLHGVTLFYCAHWSGRNGSVYLSQYLDEIEKMVFII